MKKYRVSKYPSPSLRAFLTSYITVVYYLLAKVQTSIQVAFGQVSPGTSGLRVAQSCLIFDDLNSLKERVLGF